MTNINQERPVAAQTNTTLAGAAFYIPFLEKLRLYQNYLRPDSFWERNKKDYWKHEKAILQWACSGRHQHLARNLTKQRLRESYGLSVISNPNDPQDTNYHIKNRPVELSARSRDSLVEEMFHERCGKLEPIMGNLYLKGFAEVITYGDIAEKLSQAGAENAARELLNMSYVIHSIIINNTGLLMGELVNELEEEKVWKYKLAILGIYNFLILSAITAISLALYQVTGVSVSHVLNSIFEKRLLVTLPNWISVSAIISLLEFSWWVRL